MPSIGFQVPGWTQMIVMPSFQLFLCIFRDFQSILLIFSLKISILPCFLVIQKVLELLPLMIWSFDSYRTAGWSQCRKLHNDLPTALSKASEPEKPQVFRTVLRRSISNPKNKKNGLHSRKLTWNLKITCLKRKIIFQTSIFGFHVSFRGSTSGNTKIKWKNPGDLTVISKSWLAPSKSWGWLIQIQICHLILKWSPFDIQILKWLSGYQLDDDSPHLDANGKKTNAWNSPHFHPCCGFYLVPESQFYMRKKKILQQVIFGM